MRSSGYWYEKIITLLFLLFSLNSFAQKDTVFLQTITVKAQNSNSIDTQLIELNIQLPLNQVLQNTASFYIKDLGINGISSISIFGSPSSHTLIVWNNVPINSPMNGQTDLSLFPSFFIDKIDIFENLLGSFISSQNPAGVIQLKTNYYRKKIISASFGSFHSFNLGINFSDKNFFFKTFFSYAKNDFKFKNIYLPLQPVQKMKNAQKKQFAIAFGKLIKSNNWNLDNKIFFNLVDRFFPPLLTFSGINRTEKMTNLNIIWSYSLKKKFLYSCLNINFSANFMKTNYLLGDSIFVDTNTIDFWIKYFSKTYWLNFLPTVIYNLQKNNTKVQLKLQYQHQLAQYTDTVYKNSFFASRKLLIFNSLFSYSFRKINLRLTFGQILTDFRKIYNSYNFGLKWNLPLKINFLIGKTIHLPTLNDLYWIPSGNPNLKNEDNFSQMLIFEKNANYFNLRFVLFNNFIKNLIIWKPTQYSYWEPENLKKVKSFGFQLNVNLKIKKIGKYFFSYTYTNAKDVSSKPYKFLIFRPKHIINQNLILKLKIFELLITTNFVSKVYTTTDNSEYYALSGYFLVNTAIRKKIKNWTLQLQINNLTNSQYQTVPYRIMPPINYFFRVSYNF